MSIENFSIGCDPELFLLDGETPISAHGLIPGDKKNPYPVPGGAIQVDGTAVEFNTEPVPLSDFNSWNSKIVMVLKALQNEVKKKGNYRFNLSPVQEYSKEYLDSLPEEAKELGCDPDFNAYTLEANPRPDGERLFRTGAGHIHFGWGADIPVENREHHEICASFVKMLDATVGMFMICIDRDPRRRELYGKAGAYRAKPYGVEYRFPSNVWLTNKTTRKLTHYLCQMAVLDMLTGYSFRGLYSIQKGLGKLSDRDLEFKIQEILNTGDYRTAEAILRNVSVEFRRFFESDVYANLTKSTEEV